MPLLNLRKPGRERGRPAVPGPGAARGRPSVPRQPSGSAQVVARPPAVRELLLIATLWAAYSLGRKVANGHVGRAMANATRVWDFERLVHLPSETALQRHIVGETPVAVLANCYYAGVHFPATAAFLLWLYLARPANYRPVRNLLVALTAVAMVIHNLYPLAPPRMLPAAGMVDTAQRWGPSVYGGSPETDKLANQFAAMPSLHVGWAVLVAVTLIVLTSSRWRWLWLLHPAMTTMVVVVTANHYWLDGIVGTGLLLGVFLFGLALRRAVAARSAGGVEGCDDVEGSGGVGGAGGPGDAGGVRVVQQRLASGGSGVNGSGAAGSGADGSGTAGSGAPEVLARVDGPGC